MTQLALTLAQTPQDRAAAVSLVLSRHIGRERAIRVVDLAAESGLSERDVRHAVSDLRMQGIALCAHPKRGYWMANSPQEFLEFEEFLRSRAMHSLTMLARMRNVALPVLLGQLALTETNKESQHG